MMRIGRASLEHLDLLSIVLLYRMCSSLFVDRCCVATWPTCTRPHRPVALAISGGPRQVTVPRLKKPSALPLYRPIGCDPRPLE
eukprot:4933320-Pyramimonas_sp.AAC.1